MSAASGVFLFDGDCGFCTSSAGLARRLVPSAQVIAWQHYDLATTTVTAAAATEAAQWIDPDGSVRSGAQAISGLLQAGTGLTHLAGLALALPGVRVLAGVVYRWVALHRSSLPGGTPACRTGDAPPS